MGILRMAHPPLLVLSALLSYAAAWDSARVVVRGGEFESVAAVFQRFYEVILAF
jgi:hypothetical protein